MTFNPEKTGGGGDKWHCGSFKTVISRERVKTWFLWLLISSCHIFLENFIEIPQVVQKIWRFSSFILTVFTNFAYFDISFFKKNYWRQYMTNNVSIFYLQHRLILNCTKLYSYCISSSLNSSSSSNWPYTQTTYLQ